MGGTHGDVSGAPNAAPDLWTDFDRICTYGGRLQGTRSCDAAFAYVAKQLSSLGPVQVVPTRYDGWTLDTVRVATADGADIPAMSLIGSVPTPGGVGGTVLDVLDLGRGTPDDIALAGAAVRGRAILVRHEYTFAPGAMHRRAKLRAAADAGAAAIILVQPIPNVGPVSGWASRCPVPVFGIGIEGAQRLREVGSGRFLLKARHHLATVENLILDFPGRSPEWVVLSAHLDGHAGGESAIDNASGVAAVLALARANAPLIETAQRGLRVCVFGAEEWSLSGSRAWLATLSSGEIAKMTANINLDSIVGSPNLTALTSGFPALTAEVQWIARTAGLSVATYEPLMVNSDHASFAAQGVPALRLMAGFRGTGECSVSSAHSS